MTDNEIIKALECIAGDEIECSKCAYHDIDRCGVWVPKDAIDLINRQKAEIERLQEKLNIKSGMLNQVAKRLNILKEVNQRQSFIIGALDLTRKEIIKEFAERVKESASHGWNKSIDAIAKEMTKVN